MQAPRHRQPRRDRGKFAGKDNTLQPVAVQGKKVLLKTLDNHISGHRERKARIQRLASKNGCALLIGAAGRGWRWWGLPVGREVGSAVRRGREGR